jgi:hypothetical protein
VSNHNKQKAVRALASFVPDFASDLNSGNGSGSDPLFRSDMDSGIAFGVWPEVIPY